MSELFGLPSQRLPERRSHGICAPGVGLDDVAVPQVPVGGPGIALSRVSPRQAMAEKAPVDVCHCTAVLERDRAQRRIELSKYVDNIGPRG